MTASGAEDSRVTAFDVELDPVIAIAAWAASNELDRARIGRELHGLARERPDVVGWLAGQAGVGA